MKYKYILTGLFCWILGFQLTGCEPGLTPMEVSERFWTAVKNKDTQEIKKYIADGTLTDGTSENLLPVDDVKLGRTVIDGDNAWVDTTVVIAGKESFELPVETKLFKQQDRWKVDYDATVESLSNDNAIARAISGIADLGGQLADNLDRSLEEMQKAIPEVKKEIERIEGDMKERLPELQRKMDEFIRQLEEALEDFNKNPDPPPTTTEI